MCIAYSVFSLKKAPCIKNKIILKGMKVSDNKP